MFVTKPPEQLDEQERTPAGALNHVEEGIIWFRDEDIGCELRDGRVIERAEHDLLGPLTLELIDRSSHARGPGARPRGDDPTDRHRGKSRGQSSQCGGGACVGPLKIIEAYEDG